MKDLPYCAAVNCLDDDATTVDEAMFQADGESCSCSMGGEFQL